MPCIRCRKRPASAGRVHCAECRDAKSADSRKRLAARAEADGRTYQPRGQLSPRKCSSCPKQAAPGKARCAECLRVHRENARGIAPRLLAVRFVYVAPCRLPEPYPWLQAARAAIDDPAPPRRWDVRLCRCWIRYSEPGRALCETCADRKNARQVARAARFRAAGRCTDCGALARESRCEACRDRNGRAVGAYKQRRRDGTAAPDRKRQPRPGAVDRLEAMRALAGRPCPWL